MKGLTMKQQECLLLVKSYMRNNNRAPSRSELARMMDVKNESTVRSHLLALQRKGRVRLTPYERRGIEVVF